ncbi:MAG: hypothetical protein CSB19_01665 [Clostridiales bacterium]|nr:MAG: hypothetical protein CSB19_01665 [Clostridiales bacterium]
METTEQTTATTESAEARAARLAAEKKQAEEEAKRKAEAEAKRKAEEEAKRRAELRARTVYAKKQIALYSDPELTTPLELDVEVAKRTPLLTTEKVKGEADELKAYQFEKVGDLEQTGYVNAEDVVASLADFIRRPVDNVDYTYFERRVIEERPPVKVKGLYVTQYTAGSSERMDGLIEIANQTDINAFVIDVKDDNGNLLFHSKTAESIMPELNEKVAIKDIAAFVKKLKDNNIYLIARIVTFKSPQYAAKYTDRAITRPDGSLYKKGDGIAWATAYDRELWDYVLGICDEAAAVGFDEIQFDYVRFPVVSKSDNATIDYHNALEESKAEVIHKFLRHAYEQLADKKVYITADIFGWSGSAIGDEGIGQHWESMANAVDYVAPMMYPSHYGKGNYGIKYPDTKPAATIDASIKDILARNANLETQPITRPWIQDFTASWLGRGRYIKYGAGEVRAQIDALKANGVDEYMVWNSSNNYHADAFKNEGEE